MSQVEFQAAEPEVPICAECEHLVGRRTNTEQAATWKCAHPLNVFQITKDPVTGMSVYTYHNSNCYEARKTAGLCQPQGMLFKRYVAYQEPPRALYSRKPAGGPSKTADELLGELDI